ncbi:acyl carrier protein [Burkholderia sp. Bp8963]|uniref:acyl carrier protein n=1 Tax=Burkholderia sp. Bp8963 TaxID=2184547 RepID=UPI000F5B8030|nr:acyl carrier protein [Burkholderia sp. Bp8963]RQS70479.1 acyl carrier protein [Burkholderia sp. Bp8963]
MSQSQAALSFDHLVNRVKDALAEVTRRSDIGQLPAEASLVDDVGLDSMSVLAFFMALEERIGNFRIQVDELEHDDLQTIASVARFVHARVAAA